MVSATGVDSYSRPFLNRALIGALRGRLVAEVASLQLSANFRRAALAEHTRPRPERYRSD
jgi:hypothetical protein